MSAGRKPDGGGGRDARRLAYLVATGLAALVGWALATRAAGWRGGDVAVGLGAAWAVQAVSFWKLAGTLWSGGDALRTWVAGIAARAGGLAVVWAAARAAGRDGPDLVGSYALALVVFLLAEAGWLAVPGRDAGAAGRRGRAADR